jgi:hypothetical protein
LLRFGRRLRRSGRGAGLNIGSARSAGDEDQSDSTIEDCGTGGGGRRLRSHGRTPTGENQTDFAVKKLDFGYHLWGIKSRSHVSIPMTVVVEEIHRDPETPIMLSAREQRELSWKDSD